MNIIAIVVAATVAFVSAFLWNGPLFGKVALRLSNQTEQPKPKGSQILLNYVVFLVTATVMAGVFWIAFASPLMGDRTWFRGIIIALWLCLGFIVTSTSIEVIWKGRSWKLWAFECASAFVAFALMGAVLGAL
ncbi:MAG: hypothetical protein JWL82_32 [Parcubacteria group bacterium]|nr:hypothetical protein [Parcubacteria group bacterium]